MVPCPPQGFSCRNPQDSLNHTHRSGTSRRPSVAFSGGWFALILFCGLDRVRILEKKLKSRSGAMIPLAPCFLALALSSGWEALMVGADCPV